MKSRSQFYLRCSNILHRSMFLGSILSLPALHLAEGASATWNGTTDTLWGTTTNWSVSPVPGTGDTATFNNAGGGNVILDLGSGITLNTLSFDTASAAAYTIGSGVVGSQTLTLDNGGAITLSSTVANNQLVNAAMVLGNDGTAQTFTLTNSSTTNSLTIAGGITGSTGAGLKTLAIAGAGATTLSGIIGNGTTGTVAVSKTGTGTLTLSNANTYSGLTTVGGGVLLITNAGALGTTAAGTVVNSGATLSLGNGITSPAGESVTIVGVGVNNVGALRAESGTSTWAGNVIIGSTADTRIGANAAATLNITGSILGSGAAQAINFSGASGTGKVVLNPATNNNYAGATTVFRGTLELGKSNVIPDTSALSLGGSSVTDANLFNMAGFSETVFSLLRTSGSTIAANISNSGASLSTLTLDGTGSTGSTTYVGNILIGTGNIKLVKAGSTTQVLQNTVSNTFTGGVDVKGGGLTLDLNSMTTPTNLISASNAVSLGGGGATTLTITGKTTAVASAQTFNGSTLNTGNIALVISRNTTGTSATLNFGALTRNAGSMLNFQPATAWAASTASTTEIVNTTGINGGALPGADAYIGAWATTGTGTSARYAQLKSTGQFITGPASTAATAGDFSNVTSTSTVYSYTAGTALGANRTGYALLQNATGATTVALGSNTLTLNGILSINTGTSTYTATSGALQVGAENELVLNTASGNLTIAAPIVNKSGATDSRLTLGGAGTTTLSGANTYGGATTLNGGTLSIASDVLGAVPASATPGNLTLNGGTLATSGTMTINANRGVALNGTVTISTANTTLTIPGIIVGQGVLTKSGAGSLILSGANTITGPANGSLGPLLTGATVTGGTLVLANTSALGAAGNAINLGTAAGTALEFATDTSVNAYGFSTSSTSPATLVLNRATAGAGFNHALGMTALGANVLTVSVGAKVTSGTPSISITGINLTSGGGGSTTLNPLGTTISVTGPVFIGSNGGNAKTLALGGTSTGNSVSGDLSNGLNTLSLTKTNASTWTVSGNNSQSGASSVLGGTLKLDYSTNDTSKLADGAALTLGGGTLEISGGTHSEVVSATTLTANTGSKLTRTSGATGVVQLNVITPGNGALLNIGGSSIATTDTLNDVTTGILGPWATVTNAGVTDWAINSTNAADGPITAYASYTDIARLADGTPSGTVPNTAAANVRIIESGTTGDITLAAATTTVNTLKVGATTGAATIVLAGQTLSIGGNTGGSVLLDAGAGALTIGSATNDGVLTTGGTADAVAASLHFSNMSATNTLLINSAINNNGTDVVSVAKSGVGKVTLAGTNLFTGSANVSEGVLEITGTLATTSITAGTNGTVKLANAAALAAGATVTFGGSGKLDLNGNSPTITNLAGDISGIVTDDSAGTGTSTLTLSFAQTATVNNLFMDGATRKVALAVNNANTNTTVLANPASTFSGGLILANSATGTRLGIVTTPATTGSPGALTSGVYGTGPIIVGQASTDKAGIYINGSNVTINNAITMNTVVGTDRPGIRVDATGLVLNGTLTAGLSDFMFSTNGTGSATVNSQVTGSNGLRLGGAFGNSLTVTLANTGTANDYAGDTKINSDAAAGRSMTLILAAANQIPNGTGKGNVVVTTSTTGVGTLNLAGFSETINGLSGTGTVTSATAATLTVGDNDTTGAANTFAGTVTGALALTKIGAGALTLTGPNTYTGGTTLNAGILAIGNNSAIPSSSIITINGGNIRASGAARALSNAVTVNGDFILGRATDLNGSITLTTDTTITASNPDGVADGDSKLGAVGGPFRLTLQEGTGGATDPFGIGTGAIVINAVNTNSGGTTISSGRATVSSTGALATADLVVNAGELNLNNAAQSVTALSGTGGSINLGTGNTLTVNQATNTSYAGSLASTGALVKTGGGILTLTSANTYTGKTTINAGTLELTGSGSLSDLTAVEVKSTGSFDISGITTSEKVASLNGTSGSTLKLGSKALEFGDSIDTSFLGTIDSDTAGTLKKVGLGTFTLAASGSPSAYPGTGLNINVSQGNLVTGAGNLPSNTAFTLSGGALQTGTFSNSVGSLSVTSDPGSVIDFAGGGTPVLTFGSQGTWSGMLQIWNWNGSVGLSGTGGQLKFGDGVDGSLIDPSKVQFYSNNGSSPIGAGGIFVGNELVPVPEPTTLLLSCSALLGLIGFQRRRKGSRSIES